MSAAEPKPHNPPKDFANNAAVGSMAAYKKLYDQAQSDPESFWSNLARQELHWFKPWEETLIWKAPYAQWFVGGKTNMSYNCLDRHLTTARKNKAAIIWEGEPGDTEVITYQELHRRVCRFANALKKLGLRKGSRSIIYMPMVPELPIAMLACARLGITHSVEFGGVLGRSAQDPYSRPQRNGRDHRAMAAGGAVRWCR